MFHSISGELVRMHFTLFQEDGITPETGKVDADFDKIFLLNNNIEVISSTVHEIDSTGVYYLEFTPVNEGWWYVQVTCDYSESVFADWGKVGALPVPTELEIADAVWNEITSAHQQSGTFGRAVNSISTETIVVGTPTPTTVRFSTTLTEDDNYWNDSMVVVVHDNKAVSRIIDTYIQANGTIILQGALPYVPAINDVVLIMRVSPALHETIRAFGTK